MDISTLIYDNQGRDIYVCIEYPDGKRIENVINRYRVLLRMDGQGGCFLRPDGVDKPAVEIFLDAEVIELCRMRLVSMIVIEAGYEQLRYHMYINDRIFGEKFGENVSDASPGQKTF